MCLICVEFQKRKLTLTEAYQNQEEMDPNDKHSQEVLDMLNEALYDDVLNSDGSDYQEARKFVDAQESEEIDPAFWYDDYLDWSDYAQ